MTYCHNQTSQLVIINKPSKKKVIQFILQYRKDHKLSKEFRQPIFFFLTMAVFYCLLFFVHYFCSKLSGAIDNNTITKTKSLQNHQSIISKNGTFKLGFFTPQGSNNQYVGIWFNQIPVQTVVWVANRDKPINNSSCQLRISDDGNLELINDQKVIIWSTNVANSTNLNSTAQVLDSGNLVLQQVNTNGTVTLWQSFDHPTNTFLPGMKPTVANTPNKNYTIFRSWKSPSDPSDGSFADGIGTTGDCYFIFFGLCY